MRLKETQGLPPQWGSEINVEVLKAWNEPYAGCDTSIIRPKEFRIVRFPDGNLAFCKMDSMSQYIAREAEILESLCGLECVPSLLYHTSTAIYTSYHRGRLLSQAIQDLGIGVTLSVGWRIMNVVACVHGKGIVHSDIRPWNFIYGDDGRLYLIDFEYAYIRQRVLQADPLLAIHHGVRLKTSFLDWIDAWDCLALVWQMSSHRPINRVLVWIPLSVSWLLGQLLCSRDRLAAWQRKLSRMGAKHLARFMGKRKRVADSN